MAMPLRLSSSIMPAGVHARGPGSAATSLPTLHGWNPSTSFSGSTAMRMRLESTCAGSGSCTRMPSISARAFSRSHQRQHLFGGDAVGRGERFRVDPQIPAGLHFVANVDLGTRIVARQNHGEPGGPPLAASAATRGFSSAMISSRTRFPSRMRGIPST